jgi:PhnB protein
VPDAEPASKAVPLAGGIVPYLTLDGAAEAIDFYVRAFAAEPIGERAMMPDGRRIMNARVDINGNSLMLMDPMPEYGHSWVAPAGFNLHLHVDDADRWFDRAVEAGCTVVMPIAMQFWGDRYGSVKDPYGVHWGIGSTPA